MSDVHAASAPDADRPGTASTHVTGVANPADDAVAQFLSEIDQAVALLRGLPEPAAFPTETFDPAWKIER